MVIFVFPACHMGAIMNTSWRSILFDLPGLPRSNWFSLLTYYFRILLYSSSNAATARKTFWSREIHISNRFTNDLSDSFQKSISEVRCTENQNCVRCRSFQFYWIIIFLKKTLCVKHFKAWLTYLIDGKLFRFFFAFGFWDELAPKENEIQHLEVLLV